MENLIMQTFYEVTPSVVTTIVELEQAIFGPPLSHDTIVQELDGRKDVIALLAIVEATPCGYKIGYQHAPGIFYSWIGGVHPQFRKQGIATELILKQHQLLKERGYTFVRTHTKNRYRDMLLLNIRQGFDIIGIQKKGNDPEQTIILEKTLT